MPPQNYSPRLKEIMAEIKAVLDKHDIAGYVVLHEPGFSEYLLSIEPTWSAMCLESNSHGRVIGARVRARRKDFATAEAQRQTIENTLNLLTHLTDVLGMHQAAFAHLRALVESKVDAEYTEGVHTPHREH